MTINTTAPITGGGESLLGDSGLNIQCSTCLTASGALTGTFDGEEGTAYHAWANLTGVPSLLTSYDAFSHPVWTGSATSSLLTLQGGLLSYASSTLMGTTTVGGIFATSSIITKNLTVTGVCNGCGAAGAGEANTASNLNGGFGWFSAKSGVDLQFKSLLLNGGIKVTSAANTLTLSARATTTQILASGQNTRTNVGASFIDVSSGQALGLPGGTMTIVDFSGYTKATCRFGMNAVGTGAWEVRIINVGVSPPVFICGFRPTVAGLQGISTTSITANLPTGSSTLRAVTNSVTTTDDPVIHNVSIQLEP